MAQALYKHSETEESLLDLKAGQALDQKSLKHLQRRALYHYEKSLSAKTRSEQTVLHRGHAKDIANQLRAYDSSQTVALNLLGRIALDEGFYQLAEHHLSEALRNSASDAGCWYSLGHVKLAQKRHDEALSCFAKALDIAPGETRAATSIAYTLAQKGRVVDAFQAYRNLFQVHPDDQHIQAKLFEILPLIQADYYQPELEKDVIRWLRMAQVNHQALAPLVMSLLKHKYRLYDQNAVIDIQDLAKDKMLSLSLGKIYFTDNVLEKFIALIRKQVLLNCIASEYSDRALLRLSSHLAMHAEHNEHVYAYDEGENDIILALRNLIEDIGEQRAEQITDIAHLIILYAMYEPVYRLQCLSAIQCTRLENWPDYLQQYVSHAVFNVQKELDLAKRIPQLSLISDPVSLNVKNQYEENPYPRWLHLGYNTPTNYGRALERELVGFRAPEFFNMGTINVLIAGCGTGKHALKVAQYFRNVDVLAVDLSRRSLAYAKRKATELGIKNIRFLCADILELDQLDETFHVIECSGVLHHMKNPAAGLAVLNRKLHKRGLLKLGLYSYRAREIVRQMRQVIQDYDLPASASGIRTLRQAILEGRMPYDFQGILSSQDFYSLSGCRDLLFHVQETQYEPSELKTFIEREKLSFLGFVLPEATRNEYRNTFPKDTSLTDLQNWQQFEQQHPTMFAGMFQFYVQKK